MGRATLSLLFALFSAMAWGATHNTYWIGFQSDAELAKYSDALAYRTFGEMRAVKPMLDGETHKHAGKLSGYIVGQAVAMTMRGVACIRHEMFPGVFHVWLGEHFAHRHLLGVSRLPSHSLELVYACPSAKSIPIDDRMTPRFPAESPQAAWTDGWLDGFFGTLQIEGRICLRDAEQYRTLTNDFADQYKASQKGRQISIGEEQVRRIVDSANRVAQLFPCK